MCEVRKVMDVPPEQSLVVNTWTGAGGGGGGTTVGTGPWMSSECASNVKWTVCAADIARHLAKCVER